MEEVTLNNKETENIKENKMGTMNVHRLLITMALPMVISMLVQAMYNIVDSIFIGKFDPDAITALSLAFPVQSLIVAIGIGLGVGIGSYLSKSLGEKKFETANRTASIGIVMYLICAGIFVLFGFFGVKAFFGFQNASDKVMEYGIDYLQIISIFSIGSFMQFCFERLLQSTGKTFISMITQSFGAIVNIALDPILIFGKLGLPELGVKGAAIATIIGQMSAALLAIILNFKLNKDIKFSIKFMKFNKEIVGRILAVGIPSIIMSSIASIMIFLMNLILKEFSEEAVAVLGVYFKLQTFIFMPVFGLTSSMVPIIAYNFGAKKKDRIYKTIKYAMIYVISIMSFGTIIFEAIPGQLLSMFSSTDKMMEIGVVALRIIAPLFTLAGVSIAIITICQALGNGTITMIVSIVRQLVVLVPLAKLLSLTGNLNLVWLSMPMAEVVGLIIAIFALMKVGKKIKNLSNEDNLIKESL